MPCAAPGWNSAAGGSSGLGEADEDVVELARAWGSCGPEAVPINFLIPHSRHPPGGHGRHAYAPLLPQSVGPIPPGQFEQASCGLPPAAISTWAAFQPLGLYAANSIFVGDYLTTKGCPTDEDRRMIESLGFEPVQ